MGGARFRVVIAREGIARAVVEDIAEQDELCGLFILHAAQQRRV